MKVAGTGHRPQRLGLSYSEADLSLLTSFLVKEIGRLPRWPTLVLSGFAQGFDRALAEAALSLDIPVHAYLPCDSQDARWPPEAQASYRETLARCAEVTVVCPGPYAGWKFARRDMELVRNSDLLLALHDGNWSSSSGTGITVGFARQVGRPTIDLWPNWEAFRDVRQT